MQAANDNTYDPSDLPCGRMAIPHFLEECARGIRIAEAVDPTTVDFETWRRNRRGLRKFRELQMRALRRAFDPAVITAGRKRREQTANELKRLLERSPFHGLEDWPPR